LYNEVRPHSSLGYLTPEAFAARLRQQDAAARPATGRIAAVHGAFALHPSHHRPARGTKRQKTRWSSQARPGPKKSGRSTAARDHLSKADTIVIAAIEAGAPMLVTARDLIDRFHGMIRKKTNADLEPWIADAESQCAWIFC
jgi:hypothetical protein